MSRAFGALMLLVLPSPAVAWQGVESPHGPLPEDLDCSACHTAAAWSPLRQPLTFDHDARTGFVLTGAHARASCAMCHLDLRFDGPDVEMGDCAGCHADVHEGKMVRDCADCHDAFSFHGVDGEEVHARTSFPLTGAHRQVSCESCHRDEVGGAFTALEGECSACHADAFASARTVDHVANGYATDCTECHSTLGWSDSPTFDHAAVSGGFQLLGAHDGLRCASCHTIPDLDPIFHPSGQDDCVACHSDDYEREHGGSTFPTTCALCHGLDNWDVEDFDHALTGFALVERHASLSCDGCHIDGGGLRFPEPSDPTDCIACHQSDYDKKHGGSGVPTTCLTCHSQRNWDAQGFNHDITAFPLVGAHTGALCSDCHGPQAVGGGSTTVSAECVSCHRADYDQVHAGSGFSTECLTCHTQTAWTGATFDHALTSFPLVGVHESAACTSCHAVPGYALLFPQPADGQDCVACHQDRYDQVHAGSGFPTECLTCHTVNAWAPSTFDHERVFELESGPHREQWSSCSVCHIAPSDISVFTCFNCHEHAQASMDEKHQSVAAYVYESGQCLACHPRGRR